MSHRTVFITQRCRCSYQSGYMVVRQDEQTMIHLSEISLVVIETTAAYVSSYLLAELAQARIPVLFCDVRHNPVGQFNPLYGAHDSARRVKEQALWSKGISRELWKKIVSSKINNQAAVLEQMGLAQSRMLRDYALDIIPGDLTNREGHAAKVYFNALFGNEFSRSMDNQINAQLNYGYAILLAWVTREIVSRGYLTQLGINHCNDFNHFNLACDFMEPFRPVIDWYVLLNHERCLDVQVKAEILELFSQEHQMPQGCYRLSSIISMFVKSNLAILGERADLDSYLEFSFDAE